MLYVCNFESGRPQTDPMLVCIAALGQSNVVRFMPHLLAIAQSRIDRFRGQGGKDHIAVGKEIGKR